MIALVVLWGLLATPPVGSDALVNEADRLARESAQRGQTPGGAVELIRLTALADWLPPSVVTEHLRRAGEDSERAPLVRAVAWYLLRHQALSRLDMETARLAQSKLGLLDGFVMRPGPAPKPLASLEPKGWRPYPRGVGTGVMWLESFLRPARDTRGTLVTNLEGYEGLAVLRMGYDDAITVWLNGDEIYRSQDAHRAWLDQAAVLVRLGPGPNRLMVEVRQRDGAWRFMARVTDLVGNPLPITASPRPWGPPAEPVDGDLVDDVEHLWGSLAKAIDADPPVARDLRDMADYARWTGLPNEDQTLLRVSMLGAWEDDESPETLWSWLQLLDEDERAAVRSGKAFRYPLTAAGHFAALRIALEEAWAHFYAGRTGASRTALERLAAEAPGFAPTVGLAAAIDHDLGLDHTALGHVVSAQEQFGARPRLISARLTALQSAGMVQALGDTLATLTDGVVADPAYIFQLAVLQAARDRPDSAVALLDRVTAARPELWRYGLEAADILRLAGRPEAALERLQVMWTTRPGDPAVALALGQLHASMGDPSLGVKPIEAALAKHPGNAELETRLKTLTKPSQRPPLGPSVETLAKTSSPPGAMAHVLYHHAWAELRADGRAQRRVRRVVRLLTEEGARRYGVMELTYAPGTQMLHLDTARLLRAGRAPASPIRTERALSEPEYRLYYDLRAEVLSFARPRPGDIIEVEWTVDDTDPDPAFPGYYGELAYLQEALPRAHTRVEITGPGTQRLHGTVTSHGVDVARDGFRFEAREVPGVPYEPNMPGPSTTRAHVHLSTIGSWAELNQTYTELLAGRDAPTPEILALARQWVGDAKDPETVFRRLYAAVSGRLRYVGLEFGIHSFQPAEPSATLARGYGDCKDKATVLIAAARALGYDAHLTLVRTRAAGHIGAERPSFAIFDHAAVYVPALDRFLDPTVDRNDPWTLPPSDHGAVAFVIGVSKAPRKIPPMTATENVDRREVALRLGPDGRLRGRATWTTRGQPASETRRVLEPEGTREARVIRNWSAVFSGVEITDISVSGIAPAFDPVVADAAVDLGFNRPLPVGGGPWHLLDRFAPSGTRRTPLTLQYQRTEETVLHLETPSRERVKGPQSTTLTSPFGRFEMTKTAEDGATRFRSRLTLEVLTIDAKDYDAFRDWLGAVERLLNAPVEVSHP